MKIELVKPVITHKDADKLKILWPDYYMANDEALDLYTISQLSLKPEYADFINNLQLKYNWMTKYWPEYYKDTLDKLPKDPELYKQLKEYLSQYRRFGIVIPMPLSCELSKNKPVNELWHKMTHRTPESVLKYVPLSPLTFSPRFLSAAMPTDTASGSASSSVRREAAPASSPGRHSRTPTTEESFSR